jgi:hypothetical protein
VGHIPDRTGRRAKDDRRQLKEIPAPADLAQLDELHGRVSTWTAK